MPDNDDMGEDFAFEEDFEAADFPEEDDNELDTASPSPDESDFRPGAPSIFETSLPISVES